MRQDDFGLLAALEKLNGREGLAHFFGGNSLMASSSSPAR